MDKGQIYWQTDMGICTHTHTILTDMGICTHTHTILTDRYGHMHTHTQYWQTDMGICTHTQSLRLHGKANNLTFSGICWSPEHHTSYESNLSKLSKGSQKNATGTWTSRITLLVTSRACEYLMTRWQDRYTGRESHHFARDLHSL